MGNLKRQLADLQKRVRTTPASAAHAAQRGPILQAATLEELQRFTELCAQADARRSTGVRQFQSSDGEDSAGQGFPSSWFRDVERAELNALVAAWKGRAKATAILGSIPVVAVQAELRRREAHGARRPRPADGATPAERRRVRALLRGGREKLATGEKPSWWRIGLELDHLDLLTDEELNELATIIQSWSVRSTTRT
ncbi:MAG: hypothetical protein K2R98_14030 [Gemmataceae bacterium]|nr:hypothetical protein [Gemmataceae bacterium]